MASPVTLTITLARISGESSYVQAAASQVIVVPNVDEWNVVGSFLTYRVGAATTLIPNTRIVSVTIA
jgi:hypothetical protein